MRPSGDGASVPPGPVAVHLLWVALLFARARKGAAGRGGGRPLFCYATAVLDAKGERLVWVEAADSARAFSLSG